MTVVVLILFLFHFLLKYEISNRMYILKKKLTLMMNDKEDLFSDMNTQDAIFKYNHVRMRLLKGQDQSIQKKYLLHTTVYFF